MAPDFLSFAEVLEIHRDQIERYGGKTGNRDLGLLQSALATPAAGFGGRYLHGDLFEMAAAYLFISYGTIPLWTATREPER